MSSFGAPNAVVGSTTVILPSPVSGPLSSEPPQLQRSATASSGSIRVFFILQEVDCKRSAGGGLSLRPPDRVKVFV